MTTLPSAFAYDGMPYQVFGASCGAAAVTVACTRSASARSSGAIFAIASRAACRSSACLAPFLPSARSSAARAFIAARSSALKPLAGVFVGIGRPFAVSDWLARDLTLRRRFDDLLLDSCSDPTRLVFPGSSCRNRLLVLPSGSGKTLSTARDSPLPPLVVVVVQVYDAGMSLR